MKMVAFRFIREVISNRYMLKCLVIRDLKSRYTGSFLGVFWAVIHPVITVITYTFIFSFVLKARLGPEAGTKSFLLWLLCGLAPWLYFAETVQRNVQILIENKTLITKSLFPSELLPLSILLSNMLNHAIMFGIIGVAAVIITKKLTILIFYLPVYIFLLSLLIMGISWMVSSMNIFLRDIGQVINVLIGMWFFYTPIVYQPAAVPESLRILLKLNPMYYVVEGYRLSLLGIEQSHWKGMLLLFILGVASTVAGGFIFKRLKPDFAEVL
ncbi:MAG: ABC transporter permease [Nitrospirae bacterium]|nr:ABC transporter permease [Nitrospirota bacterium]